jgi:hypothetical protein
LQKRRGPKSEPEHARFAAKGVPEPEAEPKHPDDCRPPEITPGGVHCQMVERRGANGDPFTTSNRGRAPSRASGRAFPRPEAIGLDGLPVAIYEFGTEAPPRQSQSQIDFPGQRLGQRDGTAVSPARLWGAGA